MVLCAGCCSAKMHLRYAELPPPDRMKVLAEQAVARKKTELQVS